jgi:hypothetical protein
MKTRQLTALVLMLTAAMAANAQKAKRPATPTAPAPVIFAVLSGGKTLEPIAKIEKNSLVELNVEGDAQKAFAAKYYKPKTSYGLIFGGASAGSVSVGKANYPGECAGNSAESITTSKSANLNEMVMGLTTNASLKLPAAGVRRRATPVEREQVEKLVRWEFTKQKVAASALKELRYQNLTALDVDGDGTAEFVGSYWVSASDTERDLIFFIARKSKAGEYEFGYSEFSKVTPNEVMSGDLSDLDKGIGHELLLDVLDYDGDGTAEIFTIGKAFEGDNFYVYKLGRAGWKRVFETYNYRCAF